MADVRERLEHLLSRLLPEPPGSEAALAAGRARDFLQDCELDLAFDELVGAAWGQPLGDAFWREAEAVGAALRVPGIADRIESRLAAAERWDFCDGWAFLWRGRDGTVGFKAMDGYGRPLVIDAAGAQALAARLESLAAWATDGAGAATGQVRVEPAPAGFRLVVQPAPRLYLDARSAAQLAQDLRAGVAAQHGHPTATAPAASAGAAAAPSEASVRAHLRAGRVVDAVREYRALTAADLKTAHAVIEQWRRESPDAAAPPRRSDS